MIEVIWAKENLDSIKDTFTRRNMQLNSEKEMIAEELVKIASLKEQLQIVNRESNILAKSKDREEKRDQGKILKEKRNKIKINLERSHSKVVPLIRTIPNRLHPSVPTGADEKNNVILGTFGKKKKFDFEPLPHEILGTRLGILDFERGVKVAGTRFSALVGAGAKLERVLMNFCLDFHVQEHGYIEIFVPTMINRNSLYGTGQLPKFEEDLFRIQNTDLYMSPTAEVPVTNFHSDEILDEETLPIKYCSFSSCYRAEAGSAGRDTKGYLRQKQFQKVEMVILSTPEKSYDYHEALTSHAEAILEKLELPYRRVLLCGADTGFSAAKCHDIEVWMAGQNKYREISSCSNCEDFQARRMKLRYRKQDGSLEYVHTLNGSGLALGRLMIAILEYHQQADGSIHLPKALWEYMGTDKIEITS